MRARREEAEENKGEILSENSAKPVLILVFHKKQNIIR